MRVLKGAAIASPLAAPSSAQSTSTTPSDSGATLPSTGGITDTDNFSNGGVTFFGAGMGTATSNAGGLSFRREAGAGCAHSGTGAGIATGSIGVQ